MFKYYKSYKISKKIPKILSKTLKDIQTISFNKKKISAMYIYDMFIDRMYYLVDFDIYNEDKKILFNKINKIIEENDYKNKYIEIPIPKNILNKELFELYWYSSSLKYNVIKPYCVKLSIYDLIYVYLDSLNSHTTTSNTLVRKYVLDNNLSIVLTENSFNPISDYFINFIKYEIDNDKVSKVLYEIKTIQEYLYKVKYIYKQDIRTLIFDSLSNPKFKNYIMDLILLMDSLRPRISKLFQIQLVKKFIENLISKDKINISINQIYFKGFDKLKDIDMLYLNEILTSKEAIQYLKDCMDVYKSLINQLIEVDYFKYKYTVDTYFIKYEEYKMSLNI
ncbi:hypothetical protein [Arcobacter sp. s6]|uniref:hypothetical protein n=1 Tax=Arcobacter sp. s6 TaxID=3230363 RepID=UPI0034A03155